MNLGRVKIRKVDDIAQWVDRIITSFVISPVSLDPRGIVPKMGHILDTADENLKNETRRIAFRATESEVQNLSNIAEIAIGLNSLYKVARHYHLLGNKPGGSYSMLQLQML